TQKQHGEKLTCMEIEDELKSSSSICMKDSTGTLFRNSSYEDRDFQPVGGKVFPRSLSFLENGKTLVRINVNELIAPGQFPANAFAPLAGVSPETGCMNPVPFRR